MRANNDGRNTFTLMEGTGNTVERQCGTNTFELAPGKYVVVPTTTGVKLKQSLALEKAKKLAASHTTGACAGTGTGTDTTVSHIAGEAAIATVPLVRRNDLGETVFTDIAVRAYAELFESMDIDHDGCLGKTELDKFLSAPVEEAKFRWLVDKFEGKGGEGFVYAFSSSSKAD